MVENLYDEDVLMAIEAINRNGGASLGYQGCEALYTKLIYGRKLIETLPDYALQSKRVLTFDVNLQVKELITAVEKEFLDIKALDAIRELAIKTRVYGASVLYLGSYSTNKDDQLTPNQLQKGVYFNVLSPLNFVGTFTNLDPVSPYFLKPDNNLIIINGQNESNRIGVENGVRAIMHYHTTRIPLSFTTATFGFWGRTMWANMGSTLVVLSNLLHTFNRYALFGASIHIKDGKGSVSQASNGNTRNVLQKALDFTHQALLKTGIVGTSEKGEIKAIGVNGAIEQSIIWETLTKLLEMGSYDTPISLLLSQSFNNGLSEGKEDVKTAEIAIQSYLSHLRHIFDFIDNVILDRVLTDDFLEKLKKQYKKDKPAWNNDIAFIRKQLKDSYTYEFSPVFKDSPKDMAIGRGHDIDSLGKTVQLIKENSNDNERLTNNAIEDKLKEVESI